METLARNKLKNLKNLSLLTITRLQDYDNFIKDLQKKRKKEKLKNIAHSKYRQGNKQYSHFIIKNIPANPLKHSKKVSSFPLKT